jgi:hypothetical protein
MKDPLEHNIGQIWFLGSDINFNNRIKREKERVDITHGVSVKLTFKFQKYRNEPFLTVPN